MNISLIVPARSLRRQQGAALLLALVILSLIMLVGVASLQQSIVQSRIVANTNAAGLAFQAADTAIESALRNANDILLGLAENTEVRRCVGQTPEGGGCAPLQGAAQVQASSITRRVTDTPDRPITGNSTNTNVWRFYEVIGTGSLGPNDFAQVSNTQEFAHAEIAMSDTYEEKGSVSAEGATE